MKLKYKLIYCPINNRIGGHSALLFALLKHKTVKKDFVTAILEKSLDLLVAAKDNSLLQSFLSKLKVESEDYYTYASEYLKNNNKK